MSGAFSGVERTAATVATHFAELVAGTAMHSRRVRAIYRGAKKFRKHPRVVFFVAHGNLGWRNAGSVCWADALAAMREGQKIYPVSITGKPTWFSFPLTPADVRALAVRLDQWLERREAA